MEAIRGFVYRIIYQNTQNTYCVFLLKDYNEETIPCTGRFEAPKEGEDIELKGRYVEHQKYGYQFDASSIEKLKPDNMGAARTYLMNLGIKGLGEKSVEKICDYFGLRLLDVLREDQPKEIKDVPGLRQSVKDELYNTLLGEGILSELNHFFESHQISAKWSRQVYTYYGVGSIAVLEDNPYTLLRIVPNMLFNTADTLAFNLGVAIDDERRLEAGINWILGLLDNQGHTCLPVDELISRAYQLLNVDPDMIADFIETIISQGILYSTYYDDILYIYPPEMYVSEVEGVHYTRDFLIEADPIALDIPNFIERFESDNHITFGSEQKEAIELSFFEKFSLITGGPGTGKTTIIKALVKGFQLGGLGRIVLCAPTGRAAKRLTEATEFEATTIHRLLMPVAGSDSYDFTKNEDDPLDIDVIIIDEASMLNVRLYYSLMAAIPREAHVIIVGDVDQLPPIGAGFVLKDMLDSDMVPYTRLHQIYRQNSGNSIVDSAYAINRGDMPNLDANSDEFTFIAVNSLMDMMKAIIDVYQREKENVDDELDIQIISPMRRGKAGSTSISQYVQQAVNPAESYKGEVRANGITYRVGDKVIQVINNYELEVFNGEIGIIYAITKTDICIRFIHKEVRLSVDEAHMIMPAYAITVHKSQGSEYGVVIIPFIPMYGNMLQRNLLYTAVTRAKRRVIMIGTKNSVERAVKTVNGEERYTLFKERLQRKCDG
ncbi:ATP-dependent RecD-like DNA helicase [Veillonella caviae]|uniref:SF1B family DNA helicase RecD2 n=1 Tax=Veillonella caviae TaxID=248316 RepID=UPI0023565098|nr:ATP-dependent RecD-like DNA helicase [Veillonella caviae]